jgi:YggT family protein
LITDIFFNLLFAVVGFIKWSLILSAIISLLLAFNVVNRHNRLLWSVNDFLARVTDPILRPIRRYVPTYNGVDFSYWIAFVLIQIVIVPVLGALYAYIRFGQTVPLF